VCMYVCMYVYVCVCECGLTGRVPGKAASTNDTCELGIAPNVDEASS